jgi:phage repressor protein C with HTH and peptisase S24 domain
VGENRLLFPIIIDKDNNDKIEVITMKASAGYLNGYADPEYFEKLPLMNLPFRIVGKHRAFPIKGDSMPPLIDGSFVVGKFVESLKDIKDGHTYVVLTKDDGIVYKRLYNKGAHLELHSDNRMYQPYNVKSSDVLEVWEFVCTLNISDKKPEELNIDSIIGMLNSMRVEMKAPE